MFVQYSVVCSVNAVETPLPNYDYTNWFCYQRNYEQLKCWWMFAYNWFLVGTSVSHSWYPMTSGFRS